MSLHARRWVPAFAGTTAFYRLREPARALNVRFCAPLPARFFGAPLPERACRWLSPAPAACPLRCRPPLRTGRVRTPVTLRAACTAASMLGRTAATLPLQDRLRLRLRIGLETVDDLAWNRTLDQPLDVAKECVLVDANERDRLAARARTAGAADAVDVVLGNVRHVVVDDVRQRLDIDAARRDVGRDQHGDVAVLEVGERARAGALALVAMNRDGADAVLARAARSACPRRAWCA